MNVEEYVMQKCYAVDPDEPCDEDSAETAVTVQDGGAGVITESGGADVTAAVTTCGTVMVVGDADNAIHALEVSELEDMMETLEETAEQTVEREASLLVSALEQDPLVSGCVGEAGLESPPYATIELAVGAPLSPEQAGTEIRRSLRRKSNSSSSSAMQFDDQEDTNPFVAESVSALGSPSSVARTTVVTAVAGRKSAVVAKGSTKLDNSRQVSYAGAIDGGGWQGWHCEGALFQTLFGLLMWDTLFTCPCPPPDTRGSMPLCKRCNVFVTPFQDAPLDLGHRSFFLSRRARILARIVEIQSLSTQGLVDQLGAVYRAHYSETCRGVHWGISLPVLQLMAVCMGGPTVAAVCRAMAVNFKHFTGGAPDLMLVRVQRRTVCDTACACGAVRTAVVQDYRLVDVAELLGEDWSKQMHMDVRVSPPNRTAGGLHAGGVGVVNQPPVDDMQGSADPDAADELSMQVDDGAGDHEGGGESPDMTDFEPQSSARSATSAAEQTPLSMKNAHIHGLYLAQLAPAPAPVSASFTAPCCSSGCGADSTLCSATTAFRYEYLLEARFVEVKGPTDSLMFRQRVWLHILNQAAATSGGDNKAQAQAVVCHVKE
jgi:hypothetical protein